MNNFNNFHKMEDKQIQTAYLIKKDEDENDKNDVKEYFENVKKFLNKNPKISIGKLHILFHHKNNNKEEKKCHSTVNDKNFRRNTHLNSNKLTAQTDINNFEIELPKQELCIKSYQSKDKIPIKIKGRNRISITERKNYSNDIHYKYKSFEDLKRIFSSSKEREQKFKLKGTNNLIPLTTDNNIKKKFLDQGKKLEYNLVFKSNSEQYYQNLALKCKKRESDLLVNNIQNYRMKKQIKEYIENNKQLSEKLGNNYWLFNLRRSPKNDFVRFNYYNVGNKEREIWKKYNDYPDKDIELINVPYNQNKKNNIRFNTEINKNKNKAKEIIQKINKFDDIKIEGKNLAQKEFDDIANICSTSGENIKFRIYKDPKEYDDKYVNELVYKEIYQLKKNKQNKKMKRIQKFKKKKKY